MNSLQFAMCAHKHLSPRIPERLVYRIKLISHYWDLNPSYGKNTVREIRTLKDNKTDYGTFLLLHVVRF